jgi:hypothetical protein
VLGLLASVPKRKAQTEEFDSYKLKLDGFGYSCPSGHVQGSIDSGPIDLQKDLGFGWYSTYHRQTGLEVYTQKPFLLASFNSSPPHGPDARRHPSGANL